MLCIYHVFEVTVKGNFVSSMKLLLSKRNLMSKWKVTKA